TLADLFLRLPLGVRVLAVRDGGENRLARPEHVIAAKEVLLLGSEDATALNDACDTLGSHAPGRIVADRSHLDYLRVFASRQNVIGRKLSALDFPAAGFDAMIVQIRRGDADLLPGSDLIVEYGDRIGLFCDRT